MKPTKTLRFKSGKTITYDTVQEAADVRARFPRAEYVADQKPAAPKSNAKPVEVPTEQPTE